MLTVEEFVYGPRDGKLKKLVLVFEVVGCVLDNQDEDEELTAEDVVDTTDEVELLNTLDVELAMLLLDEDDGQADGNGLKFPA
jgi:hypothetical protein